MKNRTAAQNRYLSRVRETGCLICGNASIAHHLQCFSPRNDYGTISLCNEHHQGAFSIHTTKRAFQAIHGDDMQLLAKQIEAMA